MDTVRPDRWQVLSPYLDEALALPDEQRAAWLGALHAQAPSVADDIGHLLEVHEAAVDERFLERELTVTPATAPAVPGQAIGPYALRSQIGQGGMGTVWLAERSDGRFERRAAIKFLTIALGERGKERFRREGTILARLTHPNIAQLLDAGVTPAGQPYLVLEYVDGHPIDEHCDREALDVRARLRLFLDVLAAVGHAHANLIVHRDLKPSNILVDRSGAPKLLDFGIARIVDVTAEPTSTRERLLTPAYASPEQARGLPPATTSDIYSLGAVLYRLLTGRPPHVVPDGATSFDAAICAGEPAPPRRVNPAIPVDVDCIVRKALRKEPGERYGSVDAFAEDLRAFLEVRPVKARSGNAWYRTRKFLRRYWMPVAVTALVIGSLAAGFGIVERARAVADRRFDQLRQFAGRVIAFDDAIKNLPGSTDARHRLVAISLDYLEGLASDARGDVSLMRELGEAYWRIARLQGVPVETNLGESAAAEASLKKADALIAAVLASRPSDRSALLRSATIAHDLMILAQSDRRNDEALAYARAAAARIERLLRAGPPEPGERRQIATLYGNVALALVNMHRYAEAIPNAEREIAIARPDPAARGSVGFGLSLLASALRFEGDLDAALGDIKEARAIQEAVAYSSPTVRMTNLYGVLLREGLIFGGKGGINLGRPDEAIEPLQKAFDLSEIVARADPRDSMSRSRVGTSGRELGNVLRDRDPRRASTVYDEAIRRLHEIAGNRQARRDEAMTLAESSYALRGLGRFGEARQRVEQALALLKATKDLPADRIALDSAACTVVRAQADELAADRNVPGAIDRYVSLIGAATAAKADPYGDLLDAAALSRLYRALADLYRRSGDASTGSVVERRRLELWRAWEQKLPGNAFVGRQIASIPER